MLWIFLAACRNVCRETNRKKDSLEGRLLHLPLLFVVSALCIELHCENCVEFADHSFDVTHRTNEFTTH